MLSLLRDLLAVLGLTWVICTLGVIAGVCVAMWRHKAGTVGGRYDHTAAVNRGPTGSNADDVEGGSPRSPAARWHCPVCGTTAFPISNHWDSVPHEGTAHGYSGTLVCDRSECRAEALLRHAAWMAEKKQSCPESCFGCRMERWERGEEAVPDGVRIFRCQPDELDDDHFAGWR